MKKKVIWTAVLLFVGAAAVAGAWQSSKGAGVFFALVVLLALAAVWGVFKKLRRGPASPDAPAAAAPVTLPADHSLHKDDFAVVGMIYHPQSFERLQVANPEWRTAKKKILEDGQAGKPIFHYSYINKPVTLQLDPSNEYGVDRVMVFIAGEHVGYLSEDNDAHAREILKYGSVKYITARITGGEYRIVFNDGTEQKNKDPLRVNIRIAYSV